jgi:phage terminase large subunit-like protein
MALLQGLMDTDGTVSAVGQCEFTTTKERLARDVVELLWSLGFKPLITEGYARLYGRTISRKWRIQFWGNTTRPVFRLSRKAKRLKVPVEAITRSQTRQIVDCKQVPSVAVRCIQVDAPDGMFVVGRTFVPTHNSALSAPVGLYMLCADGEYGAEVYCGATSEKQALEVFRPARDMARGRPDLIERFGIGVHASNIHVESTASRFEPIIGKPGDGSSPHCSIVDEFHEHDTSELWDTMLTGMGARDQPMMWGITTAGTNLAGPCFDHVLSGRKLLEGLIDDEERFYLEYSIDDDDDWTSPEALRKANPNMGVSVLEDFLLARQRDAIRNPRDQAIFKTKHLNVWVNSRSAYFNMQSWAACYDPAFREADYHGRRAILGLDLASKNDIAALVALIPLEDGRIATFGRYYLPEDALENAHNRDLYYAWSVRDPAPITLTEGNIIDFERIEADIDELRRLFTIDELIFDPSQATMLTTRLMAKGVRVTQFDQNARNFSEPMKQTAALMDGGKLVHGCDPQHPMSWMMSNVEARVDAKDQVYPRKAKPENKIDGPVAMIMAMSRTLSEVVQSVYETRGLMVL